jgi:hypothetical protein
VGTTDASAISEIQTHAQTSHFEQLTDRRRAGGVSPLMSSLSVLMDALQKPGFFKKPGFSIRGRKPLFALRADFRSEADTKCCRNLFRGIQWRSNHSHLPGRWID